MRIHSVPLAKDYRMSLSEKIVFALVWVGLFLLAADAAFNIFSALEQALLY
jgi:hypothetical protein